MLGGLMPTFVNLLSPDISDVPGRLVAFIVGAAVIFLVAVTMSPETRGRLDVPQDVPQAERPATVAERGRVG
jgi:hypothetical protein